MIKLEHTTPEQFKAITKNLEQQCDSAWAIVNGHRDPNDCPESMVLMANGLVNFLTDLGVPGYEMD